MATVSGSLVKLYLYKAEWTLTIGSSSGSNFYLNVGGETTAAIADTASAATIQTALQALTPSTDVTVTGSSSPFTIAFAGDYAFSGIKVEVESADSGVTVSVARSFPASITSATEGNGFYKMGSESNLDKSFNIETQDITSKDSSQWRETVSQIRGITASPSVFYLSTENYSALVNQFNNLQPVIICDVTPEQYQHFGVYNINSLTQNSAFNQVVEFTAEFELTGSVTEVTT